MALIKKIINKYNSIDSKLYNLFDKNKNKLGFCHYLKNINLPIAIIGFILFNILFITTSDFSKYSIIANIFSYIIGGSFFLLFLPCTIASAIVEEKEIRNLSNKNNIKKNNINIPFDDEENNQNEDEYYEPTKEEMIEKMKNSYFKAIVN